MGRPKVKLQIEIENLTQPQALAIQDMLRVWMNLGSAGASRWVSFYADGDGDFKPKVLVNGLKPERCLAGRSDDSGRWENIPGHSQTYFVDFDEIGWWLRAEEDKSSATQIEDPIHKGLLKIVEGNTNAIVASNTPVCPDASRDKENDSTVDVILVSPEASPRTNE